MERGPCSNLGNAPPGNFSWILPFSFPTTGADFLACTAHIT